jgi:hypothetical protein
VMGEAGWEAEMAAAGMVAAMAEAD